MIYPAREHVVGQRAAPPLQPNQQAGTRVLHQLELHWFPRLCLDDDGAAANLATQHEIADPDFDHVAATKLAVDCQIEERPVAHAAVLVEKEAYSPDLPRLQRALRSDFLARVPGRTIASRIDSDFPMFLLLWP